jgi:hypothetical protein
MDDGGLAIESIVIAKPVVEEVEGFSGNEKEPHNKEQGL